MIYRSLDTERFKAKLWKQLACVCNNLAKLLSSQSLLICQDIHQEEEILETTHRKSWRTGMSTGFL